MKEEDWVAGWEEGQKSVRAEALASGGGKHLHCGEEAGLRVEAQICVEAGLTKAHMSESRGWV